MSISEKIEAAQRAHKPVRHLHLAHVAETTERLQYENSAQEEIEQAVHALASVTDNLLRITLDDAKRALLRNERAHVFAALDRLQLIASAVK